VAESKYLLFRTGWWGTNALLAVALGALLYSGFWEYSVRQYLKGFSDAIVPAASPPEQQVEAILDWMSGGPPRQVAADPAELSSRDPEATLNYQQLLSVCGSATNAFLNLSRSAGLKTRRLLLLTPERRTKHVVAEVPIDGRWVVVDPSYRVMLRDAQGHLLTRKELQNPAIFAQATARVPNYQREYDYARFAHVRTARLPLDGLHLRAALDAISPHWEESLDWSLLLERESFFALVLAAVGVFFLLALRFVLAWHADYRLRIHRFHLREHFLRAGAALFSTPEIK
jgi:Transglutaminase-like superfamily